MTRGVLYVAYGEKARQQAARSIASLRRFAPGLLVSVVGDRPLAGTELIERPDADAGARHWKTQMYELSPYDETLFLDADTELLASPDAAFQVLQHVDLVLVQDYHRNFADNHWPHLNPEEVSATIREIGSAHHMYFNSGVICFRRNDRVAAMMAAWHAEWQRWGAHDQMALLRAIHRCPVKIAPIRDVWNTHQRSRALFVYHAHKSARREGAPR